MAEHENVEKVAEAAPVPAAPAAPAVPAEKSGWLGQSPSMWFLIDSAVVLLIVLIMRLTA